MSVTSSKWPLLAYMRGRTLNDAFIILDESQNTTIEQMKMFLTRIGFNSKAVITGDITQIDLPRSTKSGLRHAIEVLAEVDEISFNFFHSEDVVRHPVVARIVNAYEAWEAADQKRKAELAAERKREAREQEQNESGDPIYSWPAKRPAACRTKPFFSAGSMPSFRHFRRSQS